MGQQAPPLFYISLFFLIIIQSRATTTSRRKHHSRDPLAIIISTFWGFVLLTFRIFIDVCQRVGIAVNPGNAIIDMGQTIKGMVVPLGLLRFPFRRGTPLVARLPVHVKVVVGVLGSRSSGKYGATALASAGKIHFPKINRHMAGQPTWNSTDPRKLR